MGRQRMVNYGAGASPRFFGPGRPNGTSDTAGAEKTSTHWSSSGQDPVGQCFLQSCCIRFAKSRVCYVMERGGSGLAGYQSSGDSIFINSHLVISDAISGFGPSVGTFYPCRRCSTAGSQVRCGLSTDVRRNENRNGHQCGPKTSVAAEKIMVAIGRGNCVPNTLIIGSPGSQVFGLPTDK